MNTLPFTALSSNGELYKRAAKNFERLEMEEYHPDHIFKEETYGWPGDWEGRTILALVLLAQSTGREPKYLSTIMERLPQHLNEKGFFGRVLPQGTVDEQQLSGHSWFLRAMSEYYLWKKDDSTYQIIQNIVHHLLLPAKGYYNKYPVLPEQRGDQGSAIGNINNKVGEWYLSTDIGCAFIMLDGASQAYQILQLPELKELLDEMVAKFMTIDIAGLSFQTHATLSASRGLLRYYESTGDERLLQKVQDIYQLYLQEGMTENFANYNWFGRPEWTEPCAVIDSFIVAIGLWKHVGDVQYLEAAQHILYNGMGYGQRPNGGFGCDVCLGAHDSILSPKEEGLFEASWCCTMRGGEGLSRALEYSYFWDENQIVIPFYSENKATFHFSEGELVLKQTTQYPVNGSVSLEVSQSVVTVPKTIKLYIPQWVSKETVALYIDGHKQDIAIVEGFVQVEAVFSQGMRIELSFEITIRQEATFNIHSIEGVHSYRHGALLLGIDNPVKVLPIQNEQELTYTGDATYKLKNSSVSLTPIYDMIEKTMSEGINNKKQVLFHN